MPGVDSIDGAVNLHPWEASPNVREASGLWIGNASVNGDGSAGQARLLIDLPTGYIFSLDYVNIDHSANSALTGLLVWRVQTKQLAGGYIPNVVRLTLVLASTGDVVLTDTSNIVQWCRQLPLAIPQIRIVGSAYRIEHSLTNTNFETYLLGCGGHYWQLAAMEAGGPIRPI